TPLTCRRPPPDKASSSRPALSHGERSALALRSPRVVAVGAAGPDVAVASVDQKLGLALPGDSTGGRGRLGLRPVGRAGAPSSLDLHTPSLLARDHVDVALLRHRDLPQKAPISARTSAMTMIRNSQLLIAAPPM